MSKKEIATAFLQLASSGKVREAYEKYVHPDFRRHNAYFSRSPAYRAVVLNAP